MPTRGNYVEKDKAHFSPKFETWAGFFEGFAMVSVKTL